jgi:mannose-6-phosphate isomerase-like protein (cupin superfamily)
MPVIRKQAQELELFPKWSEINHYGINYLKVGQEVPLHYHDCNEYWIIVSGKGICTTEGDEYEIGPGDLVLTKKGDEHSLIVTEEMVAVYIYGILPPGCQIGYLYRNRPETSQT